MRSFTLEEFIKVVESGEMTEETGFVALYVDANGEETDDVVKWDTDDIKKHTGQSVNVYY